MPKMCNSLTPERIIEIIKNAPICGFSESSAGMDFLMHRDALLRLIEEEDKKEKAHAVER